MVLADLVVDAARRADIGIDLDIVGTDGNLRQEPDAACRLDQLWVLDARLDGIALPNAPSVRLHEAMGFKPVGVFPQAGHKFGRWHDVGFWTMPLREPSPAPLAPLPLPAIVGTPTWESAIASL